MTHIRSRLLLATALASLALGTVVQAQAGAGAPPSRDGQGPAGTMRRGGSAAGPNAGAGDRRMGRGGRGNPAGMLLRMRSELQLTDEQVKRLEALQDAPAARANEDDLLRARADLLDATQGDGNLSKARTALDRMSALRNEQLMAGLKQRQEVRGVLTAQQKTRLDNMRRELRQRGAMRGQRGGARGVRGGRGRGPGVGGMPFRGRRGPDGPLAPGMNGGRGRRGAPEAPVAPDSQ
jgi:Spy/CpxP family protein refolding chaperone